MNVCGFKKLILITMLGGWSAIACGAGFQHFEQNAAGIGNAFAGSAAAAENAGTIFYNPAGMTQLNDREISLGTSSAKSNIKFHNNGSTGLGANQSNGGNAGDWTHTPNVYVSWALNKDLYIGLGINRPFGYKSEYDDNWLGAPHAENFELETVNINPSLAYRVNDKVSVGIGLNWQRLEVTYGRLDPTTNLTRSLDVDDDAWGWNVGVLFNVSEAMRVGLSYRSQIEFKTSGNLTPLGNVHGDIKMPDTFILSVYQKLSDRWEMMGDISRTGWKRADNVDFYFSSGIPVERLEGQYRNTWRVALGANYKLNDAWKLKYGIAYEQSPVNDDNRRWAYMPDNNRLWLSFGTQWLPTRNSRLDLGLAYQYVKDADIDVDLTSQNRGRLRGDYDLGHWVLGAQYSIGF